MSDQLTRELRHAEVQSLEIERRDADGEVVVTALAHRTGVRTELWDMTEEITAGAFRSAIPKSDIVLNVNHGRSSGVLARTSSGTMKVWENDDGLMLKARLGDKDPEHLSLISKLERSDLAELSFAFSIDREGQVWTDDGGEAMPHRQINRVAELFDVSFVERPAYPETGDIGLRDRDAALIAKLSLDIHQAEGDLRELAWRETLLRRGRR